MNRRNIFSPVLLAVFLSIICSNNIFAEGLGGIPSMTDDTHAGWFFFDNNNAKIKNQWKQVNNIWYYFGEDGKSIQNAWAEIDGKWYYFDQWSIMLHDTTTPDGYYVGSDGAWIKGDEAKIDYKGYENKVELTATSYENPTGTHDIGFSVPVTVYYNNKYTLPGNTIITIEDVSLSKQGVPYIKFSYVTETGIDSLKTKCVHHLSDGSTADIKGSVIEDNRSGSTSYPLLTRIKNKETQTQSVEIYVGIE